MSRIGSALHRQWRRLSDRQKYRLLESIPGCLVWLSLLSAVLLSWFQPVWAIAFVIILDIYWLIRILYVLTYLIIAFRRFRTAAKVDWGAKLRTMPGWESIHHIIMIPTADESLAVLEETLTSLSRVQYPLEKLIVVLAMEARYHERNQPIATQLAGQFSSQFGYFLITEHPANLPGEVAGKGSNIAWAGRKIKEYIDQRHIPYDRILVSTFDADSVAHPQYLSYLTYAFLNHPDRLHTSYQPIPLFHNNTWDALPFMRVVANSTTFWLLSETMRPDRLFTFSSHSMPWQALVDVDFWQTDVVSEDSRIFLQGLLHYDGQYTVTPMYVPISMDVVQGAGWWRSFVNQYKQIRRWAYGVENFPFMTWNFLHGSTMTWSRKIRYIWYQIEGAYSWAVAPMLIIILGWLPFHIRPDIIQASVLAQNAPRFLQALMLAAMTGALVSGFLSVILMPSRPQHVHPFQWLLLAFQWLLLPITMIAFGSLPAIEAQTRLMLGKYLGFWVTEKSRTAT